VSPFPHPFPRSSGRGPCLAAVLLACLGSCGPDSKASGSGASASVEVEIRDLVAALTPLPPSSVPVLESDWFQKRNQTLKRLRAGTRAHGLEALRLYREAPPEKPEIRAGLLDVAAHTAPEETAPLLVELVTTFGEDLLVRRRATEVLGECVPARAIEVIEPILRERYDDRTYPPEEHMLAAWIVAAKKSGLDPVPLLAEIATDLHRPQEVRHLATRSLGEFDAPQSRQALQVLLVESSGNAYIRRKALQALVEQVQRGRAISKEEFCKLIEQVQSREADPDFLKFMESARNANCR